MFCRSPLYSQDFTPLFFNPEDFTPFFFSPEFFHSTIGVVSFASMDLGGIHIQANSARSFGGHTNNRSTKDKQFKDLGLLSISYL